MTKSSTQSIVYTAIGTALIVALSQISITIGPVPFTLQTLAIGLIASLYKPKDALTCVGIYLLLGAIGLPVFAGFSGGFAHLIGPTSGFLWGFLSYAGITATLTKSDSRPTSVFLATLLGTISCFLLGSFFFKFSTGATWSETLSWTILPFLLPDLIKITLITILHQMLRVVTKKEAYFL